MSPLMRLPGRSKLKQWEVGVGAFSLFCRHCEATQKEPTGPWSRRVFQKSDGKAESVAFQCPFCTDSDLTRGLGKPPVNSYPETPDTLCHLCLLNSSEVSSSVAEKASGRGCSLWNPSRFPELCKPRSVYLIACYKSARFGNSG